MLCGHTRPLRKIPAVPLRQCPKRRNTHQRHKVGHRLGANTPMVEREHQQSPSRTVAHWRGVWNRRTPNQWRKAAAGPLTLRLAVLKALNPERQTLTCCVCVTWKPASRPPTLTLCQSLGGEPDTLGTGCAVCILFRPCA